MIKNLLLKLVTKKIEEYHNPLFILKGFSINSINSFLKVSTFNRNLPISDSQILIKEIEKNYKKTIRELIISDVAELVLYEEAIKLNSFDLFDRKVILIDSGIALLYNYEGDVKPFDTEKTLFDLKSSGKNILSNYYSEIIVEDNFTKIAHFDIVSRIEDEIDDLLEVVKLFEAKQISPVSVTIDNLPKDPIWFESNGSDLSSISNRIFNDEAIADKYNIVADNEVFNDFVKRRDAERINGILIGFNVEVNWFTATNAKETTISPVITEIFKKHWGKDAEFKAINFYDAPEVNNEVIVISQGEIVQQIINQAEISYKNSLSDKKEAYSDVFLTAPTGAGKSLLFQVPAFYLSEKYQLVTIIISPLIALMKDQVNALKTNRNYEKVAYINSELSLTDREEIINDTHEGKIDILYLSPELFLSYSIDYFIGERKLGLLVVDEAHLVTTWGRDFRVDYWFLGNHLNKLRKYVHEFPILTVTATAVYGGDNDMVYDTIDSLYLNNTIKYIGKVTREDILFDIKIEEITGQGFKRKKFEQTVKFIKSAIKSKKKTLIYCPYTTHIEEIYELLNHEEKMSVCTYYGSMRADDKQHAFMQYLHTNVKVMICTKAFGMGVDISDIELVYHHAASGNLADYVQEIGRVARRKDIIGTAKTNYASKDLSFTKTLYGLSSIKPWELSEIMRKIYNVYEIKKSQNFLVDINQFQHIYPEDMALDNKVKSGIMMIEKDLLKKHGYNVLIGRPKNLFAHVYARIIKDEFDGFMSEYRSYTTYIKDKNIEDKGYKVICIRLDELWADKFSFLSFPFLKSKFFKKELFEKYTSVSPQQEIDIELHSDYDSTMVLFKKNLDGIRYSFGKIRGRIFTKQDFEVAFGSYIIDRSKLEDQEYKRKIANIINKVSSIIFSVYTAGNNHAFLQRTDRTNEGVSKYRLINSSYDIIMSDMVRKFANAFGGIGISRKKKYYLATAKTINEGIYMMAYLLEAFELGTYIIAGGKMPVMFIRLNDPKKFKKISESFYENSLLTDVYNRHIISMSLFTYFFNSGLSDIERWNFIEDYFLGYDTISLVEKYCKISGHNSLEFLDGLNKLAGNFQLNNN